MPLRTSGVDLELDLVWTRVWQYFFQLFDKSTCMFHIFYLSFVAKEKKSKPKILSWYKLCAVTVLLVSSALKLGYIVYLKKLVQFS